MRIFVHSCWLFIFDRLLYILYGEYGLITLCAVWTLFHVMAPRRKALSSTDHKAECYSRTKVSPSG